MSACQNDLNGAHTGEKSKIKDSEFLKNAQHGVVTDGGANLEGNVASKNTHKRIVMLGPGGRISGNTVDDNGETGLELQSDTAFDHNALRNNPTPVTSGVDAGTNVCGTALCP